MKEDFDDYVFPQTVSEDKNFDRTGGLTKRELLAFMIFAKGKTSPSAAVSDAEALLDELERPARP